MWIVYHMAALEIVKRFTSQAEAYAFAAKYSKLYGPVQVYKED